MSSSPSALVVPSTRIVLGGCDSKLYIYDIGDMGVAWSLSGLLTVAGFVEAGRSERGDGDGHQ